MKKPKCLYCGKPVLIDKVSVTCSPVCEECRKLPICEGSTMLSYVKDLKDAKSQLCNCIIGSKVPLNEPMFYAVPDVGFICNLDGYAIIPVEEYNDFLERYEVCWWCRLVAWFRRK